LREKEFLNPFLQLEQTESVREIEDRHGQVSSREVVKNKFAKPELSAQIPQLKRRVPIAQTNVSNGEVNTHRQRHVGVESPFHGTLDEAGFPSSAFAEENHLEDGSHRISLRVASLWDTFSCVKSADPSRKPDAAWLVERLFCIRRTLFRLPFRGTNQSPHRFFRSNHPEKHERHHFAKELVVGQLLVAFFRKMEGLAKLLPSVPRHS
jgi:hypothetical protein